VWGGGGCSIGLSPVNFVSWEWADGRYFNFRRHSLRPMKVTYLTSTHTSRRKLPILRRLLDKPTKVIVADGEFSFSCSVDCAYIQGWDVQIRLARHLGLGVRAGNVSSLAIRGRRPKLMLRCIQILSYRIRCFLYCACLSEPVLIILPLGHVVESVVFLPYVL
jgi:hypothetical protein